MTGSSLNEIEELIENLNKIFPLKDLEELNFFLGLEVKYLDDGYILLSQEKYAAKLLEKAGMSISNAMPTPMISSVKLHKHDSEPCENPGLYRSIVGVLQYLTTTRLDLSYAVNKASQFMHNLTAEQWKVVKRILRYIKGTRGQGLIFSKSSDYMILAFADADWGADLDDCRSVTGYYIYLGENLIAWKPQKQSKVSKSSTEAEYRVIASAQAAAVVAVQQLL
ncbi:uncharacterized protein LOC107627438 [Arachis ipaensis]|uniref:uncharacterized protein LOC107627438 n=1 Tax=Arachis ipaensis TaxID=130454 RepID=UPI0007AF3CAE|nr:uncharacterized protein LOC107627438 [Arachis ipaensis]XP_025636106.1 uncharacterized protein LOC112730224 [Arachis hypogaea]